METEILRRQLSDAAALQALLEELQARGIDLATTNVGAADGEEFATVVVVEIDFGDGSKAHDIRLLL